MANYSEKEKLYLQAKQFYYEGNPIMSDFEFDSLEDELKNEGSTVHLIVGSTDLKELTYKHLSPMLSLDKEHATEDNICISEMIKFFGFDNIETEDSPKFDGSSCNIIYRDGKIDMALTRGNGVEGQNITSKMKLIVPNTIDITKTLEIRGEVVIPIKIFNEKYFGRPYQNERNMVAGVLGREKDYEDTVKDFHFVAYEVKEHVSGHCFHNDNTYDFLSKNGFIIPIIKRTNNISEFKSSYDYFLNYRNTECPYRLDGIVKKVIESKRSSYGEHKKAPKWAMAIKFPAKEAKAKIIELSYTLGVTGELSFVANIEPTRLDGSTVSRVSVNNLGNIIKKGLFPGAEIILVKSGDIIPFVKSVTKPNYVDEYEMKQYIPTLCPACGCPLVVDDIHLMCKNEECDGKVYNRFEYGIKCLDIKHIGEAGIRSIFDSGIKTIIDFFDDTKFNKANLINSGYFKDGRALEIIINARNKVTSLTLKQVIQALKFKDVGESISEQVANYLEGKPYSWSGLTKEAIAPFLNEKSIEMITLNKFIETLTLNNIKMIKTEVEVIPTESIIYEMTGSPKEAGYAKKEDFVAFAKSHGYFHGKLNKDCNLLVTDSMSSSSSKMNQAIKLQIEIMTYDDLINKLK